MTNEQKNQPHEWAYRMSRLVGSIAVLLTIWLAVAIAFKTEPHAEQIATWLFMSFVLLAITITIELWFDRMH